jgi:hypothetical protein
MTRRKADFLPIFSSEVGGHPARLPPAYQGITEVKLAIPGDSGAADEDIQVVVGLLVSRLVTC